MINFKKTVCIGLSALIVFSLAACGKKNSASETESESISESVPVEAVDDNRNLNDYEFARNSISSVDALGRVTFAGDGEESRDVGLFYFLWLGAHASGSKIYDVSYLEENDPDSLWSEDSEESPANTYHFWGEPLYGYYHSADPWVITRHVELFTMIGIDYLLFDVTNAVTYDNVLHVMLPVLDKYQKQGWDVPKVGFMTNARTYDVVKRLYASYYDENTSDCYYPNLWYCPNGKPIIMSNDLYFDESKPEDKVYLDFFQIRDTQWPDAVYQDDEAFPWMSWTYPQKNHSGTMSVSVAQHTAGKMSLKDANWGRNFSQKEFINLEGQTDKGINFQFQWDTALNAPKTGEDAVNNVFVTGWNEWIAIKFANVTGVYFVDTFNEEYSRDIEMMKGGYGDNYYLQLFKNIRAFKYSDPVKYKLPQKTIDVASDNGWNGVRSYPDFIGEAMNRNYRNYLGNAMLTDDTARNDIASVKVAHDSEKMYFRVETAADVTPYENGDKSWMNIRIGTKKDGIGYDYVINREYGKLSKIENGKYSTVCDCEIHVSGNVMTVAVPLALIGQTGELPAIRFKVSDNVDASDVMNFYIQGDSAPVGRLSYTYGYFD